MSQGAGNGATRVAVLGAGSWGTALAALIVRHGHTVSLWGRDRAVVEAIAARGENPRYLPGIALPEGVQATTALPEEPDVTVRGFPFLTQALSGRYDRVDISARDAPAGEMTLTRLDTTLRGVRVTLSQALSGSVGEVPVDAVEARALLEERKGDIGYGDLLTDDSVAKAVNRVLKADLVVVDDTSGCCRCPPRPPKPCSV
ncbi:MAG: LmeA family phospholipid-binding protein [Proteobacteria bacterium]|nr:LmeA family phospholipid-binding protein [Pseudomonadota bacterium]